MQVHGAIGSTNNSTTTLVSAARLKMTAGCRGSGKILIDIKVGGATAFSTHLTCADPVAVTTKDLGRFKKGSKFSVTVNGQGGTAVYYVDLDKVA